MREKYEKEVRLNFQYPKRRGERWAMQRELSNIINVSLNIKSAFPQKCQLKKKKKD